MKFEITLKDPDGFYESIQQACEDYCTATYPNMTDKGEIELITENRKELIENFLSKWVEYGEYINLEADMEAGTLTVKLLKG